MSFNANYVGPYTLTIPGNYVAEAHFGRRILCDCGVDGEKGVTVSGSSWGDPLTTVNMLVSDSDALTSNLVSFKFGPGVTTDKYGSISARGIDHDELYNYLTSEHFTEASIDKYTQAEVDTISGSLQTDIDTKADSSHTVLSHDTDTTGAELTSLADNSMVDALHRHSELSASDGSPDRIVYVDTDGVLYADYAYGIGLNVMHSAEIGDHLIVGNNITVGGNVGIGVSDPHSKLQVAGAISSATATVSSSADSTNVSGINTLWVDTTSDNITLGGLAGGVDGQVLNIVISVTGNNLILAVDTGTQPFINHTSLTETIDGGGAIYVCDGTHWHDASHAKHV